MSSWADYSDDEDIPAESFPRRSMRTSRWRFDKELIPTPRPDISTAEERQKNWLSDFLPWLVRTGFTPYDSLEYNAGFLVGDPRQPNRIRYNEELLSNMLIIL